MSKIIVAGGTGFVGQSLITALDDRGEEVILLTRDTGKVSLSQSVKVVEWDGKNFGNWSQYLEGAHAVINLSGAGIVDKRWNENRKKVLRDSRVLSTRALVQAFEELERKPSVLINASAVGYYGHVPDGEVDENAPRGEGFLSDLCDDWEKEAKTAESLGVRVVLARIGIVLERHGGALKKMLPPFKFFIGGSLGSGRQWFPWIHLEDLVSLFLFSLDNEDIQGPINMTAPNPLTMKGFCVELGKVLHRPSFFPVPAFVLRALMGEMSDVLLTGKKAIPSKSLKLGFSFKYPEAASALQDILIE